MSNFTPGPWMVRIQRDEDGLSNYRVEEHTHAAISLERAYWAEDHDPPTDCDGYLQPDEQADISEHRVANARLIALAPEMLEALDAFTREPAALYHLDRARALIDRARGEGAHP